MEPADPHAVHTDDLEALLAVLPEPLRRTAAELPGEDLLELVLDLGRRPQARLADRAVDLREDPVTRDELAAVTEALGAFGGDNRAGIEGTLHRIAALRNRRGDIVGLTLRVGRSVTGTLDPVRDTVEAGASLLLLGRPGVGKTTMLREAARILADEQGRRVVVIDTSNEIAGDGDIPHPAIGSARRMQVPAPEQQHAVMIEAVENHMPEVVVIDEIGTAAEAAAARTIAERGVQLVGTAHGNTLDNLITNPTLADLVGGVQTVTLGDEEARLRGTRKSVQERPRRPTFAAVVEIAARGRMVLHGDTARAVDLLLAGRDPGGSLRLAADAEDAPAETAAGPGGTLPPTPEPDWDERPVLDPSGPVRIYPYALSRDHIERVIRELDLDARTVRRPEQANLVLAIRARTRDPKLRQLLADSGAPLHVVKKNTTAQIRRLLERVFRVLRDLADEQPEAALDAAEEAAQTVLREGRPVALAPQTGPVRQQQHQVALRHHLQAEDEGSEPLRHLVVLPG